MGKILDELITDDIVTTFRSLSDHEVMTLFSPCKYHTSSDKWINGCICSSPYSNDLTHSNIARTALAFSIVATHDCVFLNKFGHTVRLYANEQVDRGDLTRSIYEAQLDLEIDFSKVMEEEMSEEVTDPHHRLVYLCRDVLRENDNVSSVGFSLKYTNGEYVKGSVEDTTRKVDDDL